MALNALTILGSSSALPTSKRFPTAQVLQMLGRFFLIDCGEGTQIQLRRAKVSFTKIQAIFISHLHGDHYLGIFGVLATFNLLGRKTKLIIVGPPELEEIVKFNLRFLEQDLNFEIEFRVFPKEDFVIVYEDKKICVKSFKLRHGVPCWGIEFSEKEITRNIIPQVIDKYGLSIPQIVKAKEGDDVVLTNGDIIPNEELVISQQPKSYVFVTDTMYKPSIAEKLNPPTLLYHEATFMQVLLGRAKSTYHSTTIQAANFAQTCKANRLLIGHYSARYKNLEPLLNETSSVFENTELAIELQTYNF